MDGGSPGGYGGASSIGFICGAVGGERMDGGSGAGGYSSFIGAFGAVKGGGAGGSDGSDGEASDTSDGGKGQHTTTRYFGESNGTLYAGGGGTGCGKGGAGGGADGATWHTILNPGAANTGGGAGAAAAGGGGGYTYTVKSFSVTPGQQLSVVVGAGGTGGPGGSGICIIRWGK